LRWRKNYPNEDNYWFFELSFLTLMKNLVNATRLLMCWTFSKISTFKSKALIKVSNSLHVTNSSGVLFSNF
jgi:hypothetical protein